ncbi:hypothetical protein [Thalassobaculum sp.]|uniref:hypothetical protein n=1 Tax=Thalassobaculum sp. TaxID=2022740 RepID=UPI0032ECE061
MPHVVTPVTTRTAWFASASLLALGSLILAFGIGWAAVEAVSIIKLGSGSHSPEYGRSIVGAACVVIVGGLLVYAFLRHLESDERTVVQIDFDRPIVGFHGKRLSVDRWRVEAQISVLARRALAPVVHDRADEIAHAAAEALAMLGPRAAHRPDRTRAEEALTVMINRTLRNRVVQAIRIRHIDLTPAL